jgi:trk system potassium uptake protein TrkH
MRIRVVLHYLGLLIVIEGLAMLLPLGWSLFFGEPDALAFALSIAVSLGAGLLLWRLIPLAERGLSRREAVALVAGGWIVAPLFGALPYFFAGALPNYLDALFETVSGFSTTGASVITSVEAQYHGILFWRSFSQWLGGMGIIALFVVLFPVLGIGGAYLVEAESSYSGEKLTARIRDTFRALIIIYMGLSLLQFILLLVVGAPVFDSFTISMTTLPTGGFTTTNISIGAYHSVPVEVVTAVFMVLGGTNFGLFYLLLWKHQVGSLLKNPEFRLYIAVLTLAILILGANLMINMGMSLANAFRYGGFQAVSILTTTGFSSTDFNTWSTFAKAVLLLLMLIGPMAGSTGGAIKMVRLVLLAKYIRRRVVTAFNPTISLPIKIGDNVLSEATVSRLISLPLAYVALLIASTLVLTAVGMDGLSALSAVTTCQAGCGPGLGSIGPLSNYSLVPPLGKGVLMFCMLAGRLELFTLFAVLTPSFWKWR